MANSWCWVKSLRLRTAEYGGRDSRARRSASWATARGDLVIGVGVFMEHERPSPPRRIQQSIVESDASSVWMSCLDGFGEPVEHLDQWQLTDPHARPQLAISCDHLRQAHPHLTQHQ